VRPTVVVRFSPDPQADLAALARTLPADVVVVGAVPDGEAGEETGPPDVGDAALVSVPLPVPPVDPGTARVGVLVDRGPAGRAALRLGTLLAGPGPALAVGGVDERWAGRRLGSVTAALQRHGVAATELGSPPDVDVLLVSSGAGPVEPDPAAVVLRVRPAVTDADDDLDEALARVAGDAVRA
jgi:hypothetical protein